MSEMVVTKQLCFDDLFACEDNLGEATLFQTLLAPDNEWYEWSPKSKYVCHMSCRNGETICVETIKRGKRLSEMYLDKDVVIENWREAFINHHLGEDITYSDLCELALHGLNIKRLTKDMELSDSSFPTGVSKESIIKNIEEYARATAICDEVTKNLKHMIERDAFLCHVDDISPEYLKKWFGIQGSSGPDMPQVDYDGAGMELSWSKAEEGSIYPIIMSYKTLAPIYNQVYGEMLLRNEV